MKNQWRLYLGLFFTFTIIIFAILNNQEVSISLGFTSFSSPLVLVIFGSAFLGALIVSLVVTGSYWRQRNQIKHLKNQLEQLELKIEQEVEERLGNRILEEESRTEENDWDDPFSF